MLSSGHLLTLEIESEKHLAISKSVNIPGTKFDGGSDVMEECQKTFCSSWGGLRNMVEGDLNLDNALADNLEDGLEDEAGKGGDSTASPDILEPDPDAAKT